MVSRPCCPSAGLATGSQTHVAAAPQTGAMGIHDVNFPLVTSSGPYWNACRLKTPPRSLAFDERDTSQGSAHGPVGLAGSPAATASHRTADARCAHGCPGGWRWHYRGHGGRCSERSRQPRPRGGLPPTHLGFHDGLDRAGAEPARTCRWSIWRDGSVRSAPAVSGADPSWPWPRSRRVCATCASMRTLFSAIRCIWKAMCSDAVRCARKPRLDSKPGSRSPCWRPSRSRNDSASRSQRAAWLRQPVGRPAAPCARLPGAGADTRTRVASPVDIVEVRPGRGGVMARTATGRVVQARHLVFATGYELAKGVPTAGHAIASTWAIATRPQPRRLWPERCFIWEASDPYLYLRATPDDRIICGGEDEEFADERSRDALLPRKTATLERKLKALLPRVDARADFAWCGSFGGSTSGTPTIGPVPGMPRCYAVLGYGGNGITFAALAAQMLRSHVMGCRIPTRTCSRSGGGDGEHRYAAAPAPSPSRLGSSPRAHPEDVALPWAEIHIEAGGFHFVSVAVVGVTRHPIVEAPPGGGAEIVPRHVHTRRRTVPVQSSRRRAQCSSFLCPSTRPRCSGSSGCPASRCDRRGAIRRFGRPRLLDGARRRS